MEAEEQIIELEEKMLEMIAEEQYNIESRKKEWRIISEISVTKSNTLRIKVRESQKKKTRKYDMRTL